MSIPESAPARAADRAVVTRFAPSPTGDLHLGNVRTALYNWLLARRGGGRFVVRIEDTDAERSRDAYRVRQLEDLAWLGLDWDAGPDREDERGPYLQSARRELYARDFAALVDRGVVYPCFCSPLELDSSRKAQLAAGRAPRYAGTCRDLPARERTERCARGIAPTLRFRVPSGERVQFDDLVRGRQSASTDDIGDFVVRRADGSAAFFFGNAVDDAAMGITHVLRGEDHLANTPRQILVLRAIGLAVPRYGHLSLLLDRDGTPLSKRGGAASVRGLRERGYLPSGIVNHLFRLGHSTPERELLDLASMARGFEPEHLGRAPAHFDERQLRVWQKEAVRRMTPETARGWLGEGLVPPVEAERAAAFVEAVLPNLELPSDALPWAAVAFGGAPELDAAARALVCDAGPDYFAAAVRGIDHGGSDLRTIVGAIRSATGRKGAALYRPLRAALTGRTEGPELGPLLGAMQSAQIRERLARFAPSAP